MTASNDPLRSVSQVLKTPSSDTLNDKGLLLIAGSHEESGEEEEDYDWVTDSDEENLEFECDVCGAVISEAADRFHCETCGDFDLVRKTWTSRQALEYM